jgi:hypothetical protein
MDIIALLQGLALKIEELSVALSDAQAAGDSIAKEAYDKGFADGVASLPPPVSDKIYSQEELDAAVAGAVGPLQEQVSAMQAELESLKVQVSDLQAGLEDAKIEAVAAFKSELLAKYEEQQVVESTSETGFADLLK